MSCGDQQYTSNYMQVQCFCPYPNRCCAACRAQMYDPCRGCEWNGKPYWSIVSPCQNCPRRTPYYVTPAPVTWETTTWTAEFDPDIQVMYTTTY